MHKFKSAVGFFDIFCTALFFSHVLKKTIAKLKKSLDFYAKYGINNTQ
ncbi:hypothetical protein [Avibacterium paragallinarum]|nr:hypothetical protein [Avibacterium paragallinarum]